MVKILYEIQEIPYSFEASKKTNKTKKTKSASCVVAKEAMEKSFKTRAFKIQLTHSPTQTVIIDISFC
ncbi:hypothetical protein V6N13_141025 [Hibiscus sabdariffa]|uniref:Uncharacterized protein n=1 Tax=Hibiscus sabdariffa TaxID=183260 RepID=A0ABR2Q154_9ROSI